MHKIVGYSGYPTKRLASVTNAGKEIPSAAVALGIVRSVGTEGRFGRYHSSAECRSERGGGLGSASRRPSMIVPSRGAKELNRKTFDLFSSSPETNFRNLGSRERLSKFLGRSNRITRFNRCSAIGVVKPIELFSELVAQAC